MIRRILTVMIIAAALLPPVGWAATARVTQMTAAAGAGNAFVFTVKTTGIDETFSLPLEAGGTYDFQAVWGDGSADIITAYDDAAVTHTYASAGTYEIRIMGTISGWRFNGVGDCTKIYDIKSWGPLRLGNNMAYFYGCVNLTVSATDLLNLTGTTTLNSAFEGCTSLTDIPNIGQWDTSLVTSLKDIFYHAEVFNGDVSGWNTSNVLSMQTSFAYAELFNRDISGWDMSKVTTFNSAFYRASVFNQDISGWDTGAAESFYYMFYSATAFNQNLEGWDVTAVTAADAMFTGSGLSAANYDALLIGWGAQAVQNTVTFSAGSTKYTDGGAAAAARLHLETEVGSGGHGWTITDGGPL